MSCFRILCLLLSFCYGFFFVDMALAAQGLVGLLATEHPKYDKENEFSVTSKEFISSFGANVIVLDYNELSAQPGDLRKHVEEFLTKTKVGVVLIPGDYYNYDKPPLHPNDNRFNVTKVLVQMSREKKISLVGICGGLQGAMYAQGVEIRRLQEDAIHHHLKDFSLYSDSLYKAPEEVMNVIKLDPTSRIVALMRPDRELYDENGWVRLSIPDTHSEAVLRSEKNLKKLDELGYRVVGVSEGDSVIELIEDDHGNYFFQSHPDALIMLNTTHSKYAALPKHIKLSIEALRRFWRVMFIAH